MEQQSSKSWVKILLTLGVTVGVAFFATNYFLTTYHVSSKYSLEEISKEMNRNAPKMIDDATRLDSTTFAESTLNYHYTLIAIDRDSALVDYEALTAEMKQKAQENLDKNPVMSDYRENKITLHYFFNDNKQRPIFDYSVKHHAKQK